MSEYETQLEEANHKLREQLEAETARADRLEKKLRDEVLFRSMTTARSQMMNNAKNKNV
jgi:hypothetical protein